MKDDIMNKATKLKEIKKEIKTYEYFSKKLKRIITVREHNRRYYIKEEGNRWKCIDPMKYGLIDVEDAKKLDWLRKFEPQHEGMCDFCGKSDIPVRMDMFNNTLWNFCEQCWNTHFPKAAYEKTREEQIKNERRNLERDIKTLLYETKMSQSFKNTYRKNLEYIIEKEKTEGEYAVPNLIMLKDFIEKRVIIEELHDKLGLPPNVREEMNKFHAFPYEKILGHAEKYGCESLKKVFESHHFTDEQKLNELVKFTMKSSEDHYKEALKNYDITLKKAEKKEKKELKESDERRRKMGRVHETEKQKIRDKMPKLESGERYYALHKKSPMSSYSSTKDIEKAVNASVSGDYEIIVAKSPKEAREKYIQKREEIGKDEKSFEKAYDDVIKLIKNTKNLTDFDKEMFAWSKRWDDETRKKLMKSKKFPRVTKAYQKKWTKLAKGELVEGMKLPESLQKEVFSWPDENIEFLRSSYAHELHKDQRFKFTNAITSKFVPYNQKMTLLVELKDALQYDSENGAKPKDLSRIIKNAERSLENAKKREDRSDRILGLKEKARVSHIKANEATKKGNDAVSKEWRDKAFEYTKDANRSLRELKAELKPPISKYKPYKPRKAGEKKIYSYQSKDYKVGQRLLYDWTNSGNQYESVIEVTKINPKSVRIKLIGNVPENYKWGQEWRVDLGSQTLGNRLKKLEL